MAESSRSQPEGLDAAVTPRLSIIVPVLNEGDSIFEALHALAAFRAAGAEIVVVDGGSNDKTVVCASVACDRVLVAPRGRGSQMNAGAAAASGEELLFLHADTELPPTALSEIQHALSKGATWGRFDVDIRGVSPWLPVVAFLMNLRSRLSGIATGDQAIFVSRQVFFAAGGFPDIPLMEDVAFSKKMLRVARPFCSRERVTTSGRRWDRQGAMRTIFQMWRCRLKYFLGADPHQLAIEYGYQPRTD